MTGARAWFVEGSCGDHEDQQIWPVAAFTSQLIAAWWAAKANAYAEQYRNRDRKWNEKHENDEDWPDGRPQPRSKYDPSMTYDRRDASYATREVPLDPRPE